MFKPLVFALKSQLKKDEKLIGVDENTALVGRLGGEWKAMGRGSVHLITRSDDRVFRNGQTVPMQE
jgi:cyanophycinase-like exopeptidase